MYWRPRLGQMETRLGPEETSREGGCGFRRLFNDLANYRIITTDTDHTGDLLDHTLWSYYRICDALKERHWYVESIPEEYHPVLQVSALLHDIGKGGDLNTEYAQKPNHPENGVEYMEGRQEYMWVDGVRRDLFPPGQVLTRYLAESCALEPEEWLLVTLISGLHYDIGNLFQGKIGVDGLIQRLYYGIERTGVDFDPEIVYLMVRAVTLVDVWAQRPVEKHTGFVEIDDDIDGIQRRPFRRDNYIRYFDPESLHITEVIRQKIRQNRRK